MITNLPADRFPPSLICKLYHKRWSIETSFRNLKYTLALTHFHAKKRTFIKQEIFSRMTLYNFASRLRLHTIFMQPKGKYPYHVNTAFTGICGVVILDHTDLLRDDLQLLVQKFFPDLFQRVSAGAARPFVLRKTQHDLLHRQPRCQLPPWYALACVCAGALLRSVSPLWAPGSWDSVPPPPR